jgi:hypothetical protein
LFVTNIYAGAALDAFARCDAFAAANVIHHVYVHRAVAVAGATFNALVSGWLATYQRQCALRLHYKRNGAKDFTECPLFLELER